MAWKPKLTFSVEKAKNGEWFWHVTHRNGNKLVAAETYKRPSTCERVMLNFITAVSDGSYRIKERE